MGGEEGAVVKGEFWDRSRLCTPRGPRDMGPLATFPSFPIFSRTAMTFLQYLVHVSIHPLHNNIWLHKHLGEASGDGPSLSLMRGLAGSPLVSSLALGLATPTFVFQQTVSV